MGMDEPTIYVAVAGEETVTTTVYGGRGDIGGLNESFIISRVLLKFAET